MPKPKHRKEEGRRPPTTGADKDLSGDEYECMKMKGLSQYGDSAGTYVTEERSVYPPPRGGAGLVIRLGRGSIHLQESGRWPMTI